MRQVGGDPEGAAEELAALLSGTPSERSSERLLLLGNLGALHHHLGKHNAALMYYGQAIRAGGPGVAEGQVAILRYGAALQLMQTGRPWEASSLLLAVLPRPPRNRSITGTYPARGESWRERGHLCLGIHRNELCMRILRNAPPTSSSPPPRM